jgi:uncharacterized membrane protein
VEPLAFRQFAQNGKKKILFCGDDNLDMAAVYLASVIFAEGYDLDYVPSPLAFPHEADPDTYDLLIFSDYPRAQVSDTQLHTIAACVSNGGSFLMIGGWESFCGLNREYNDSPLADILPVIMQEEDDRVNYPQGIVVLPASEDPTLLKELDWEHPGIIGGYNAITPKKDAQILLEGAKLRISNKAGSLKIDVEKKRIPLMVTGKSGKGRTSALAFDLAPHWVGGFVDWGTERKRVDFNNGFIEVGDMYYRFIANMLAALLR